MPFGAPDATSDVDLPQRLSYVPSVKEPQMLVVTTGTLRQG
jgi:hypothetical protein